MPIKNGTYNSVAILSYATQFPLVRNGDELADFEKIRFDFQSYTYSELGRIFAKHEKVATFLDVWLPPSDNNREVYRDKIYRHLGEKLEVSV